jgi:hypothetical protein
VELLERVGEHVVVAAWLAAELPSPRFGGRVRGALAEAGAGETLVARPNLEDTAENDRRRMVLDACRYGYYGVWFYDLGATSRAVHR